MVDDFVAAVRGLGFELKHKDLKNPYFLTLQFQKQKQAGKQRQQGWPVLRACQYKKR
jgi:hypothetical protein